jgi:N-methylhydantoinase A
VPAHPGLLSAIGLLSADVRGDFALTCLAPADHLGASVVRRAFAELSARMLSWAAVEGLDPAAVRRTAAIDLRYRGQSSELTVELSSADPPDDEALAAAVAAFHRRHAERFGYAMPGRGVEAVTARLAAVAGRPEPPSERTERDAPPSSATRRPVWFRAEGVVDTPVVDRAAQRPGTILLGPAIIEQMDATTVVPPGWSARADALANLILETGTAQGDGR